MRETQIKAALCYYCKATRCNSNTAHNIKTNVKHKEIYMKCNQRKKLGARERERERERAREASFFKCYAMRCSNNTAKNIKRLSLN